MAATEKQLAAMAKARAARKPKGQTITVPPPATSHPTYVGFTPNLSAANATAIVLAPASMTTAPSVTTYSARDPDIFATIVEKVEILWLERDKMNAQRRLAEGYEITYRCTECGTLVEALAPQFRRSPEQAVKCPKCFPSKGLTPMDY